MKTTNKIEITIGLSLIGLMIGVVIYNSIVHGVYSSPW
jgi:hypothetical protein